MENKAGKCRARRSDYGNAGALYEKSDSVTCSDGYKLRPDFVQEICSPGSISISFAFTPCDLNAKQTNKWGIIGHCPSHLPDH